MNVKALRILFVLCAVGLIAPACTQTEQKESPARAAPNPAEAQALPESPLVISSGAQARRVAFWMRNTFIPLDMIFIKSDGEIVSIFENVPPLNDNTVGPERPVRAVLELNAGISKKLGLKVGDVVRHAAFNNGP
jgi:hypothetical protein